MSNVRNRVATGAAAAAIAAALAAPFFADSYLQHVMILIFYTAYLSTSWNILGGYAGQLSIGHAAFLGVGAYSSTLLLAKAGISPWLGLWVGVVLAVLLGWAVGAITFRFRLRGHYFTLATIAIAESMRIGALHIDAIGAAAGLMVPTTEESILYFSSTEKHLYYYTILAMLCIVLAVVWKLERSKTGIYWLAIREDEHAAEAAGIDTGRYKLRAMMLSSAFLAAGGTFYAQYVTYIDPETVLGVLPSVEMLLPAIVGGMGTLFGPLVGAMVLVPLSEATKAWFTSSKGVHMLVYGIVLMFFLRFLSQGLLGTLARLRLAAAAGSEEAGVAPATEKHK